jgi:integrase
MTAPKTRRTLGTLTERSPGTWRLRATVSYDPVTGNPVQASKTFHGTKREAEAALAAFVSDTKGAPLAATTLGAFISDEYLPWVREHREGTTYASYADKARRIIADLGHIRLTALSARDLDKAYAAWRAQGMAPGSVRCHHKVVSGALTLALRYGAVKTNVAHETSPPKVPRRTFVMPTPADVRRLVDDATARGDTMLATAVLLAATTGLRLGELVALRWSDVDRERSAISIGHSVKRAPGGGTVVGATKTGTERWLPIDPGTLAMLDAQRPWESRPSSQIQEAAVHDAGYILFSGDPQDHLAPSMLGARYRSAAKRLGVPGRFHDLRHLVATSLLGAGVDLATVSHLLGHASPTVTLSTYSHFVQENERRASTVMSGLLGLD